MWKRFRRKHRQIDVLPQLQAPSESTLHSDSADEGEKQRPQTPRRGSALQSHDPLPAQYLLPPPSEITRSRSPSRATSRSPSRSGDRRSEPQGLHTLHDPGELRVADIVFVHGLGGSSISTWTKDGDEATFWPQKFLACEQGLSNARIMSFGYTAFFMSAYASSKTSITDFARSLLADLKNEPDRGLGDRPIIFVAHSLGGLVVKKAYVIGRFDDNFKDIIASITGMVFLGTPHRGTDLAKLLNKLLSASTIGPSPKQYVADLAEDSPAIEDLNDQFRNIPSDIKITSFYETRYLTLGYRRLIVERKSSWIGCRGEVLKPLDADHHHICKFGSPEDSNYISVRNTLKSILMSFSGIRKNHQTGPAAPANAMEKVSALLDVAEVPQDDFDFYHDRKMLDTCTWILSDSDFAQWMDTKHSSRALWISGAPGSGKSVLTSFLIDYLRSRDTHCNYYFFRSGDRSRRSASSFLRSIAFQIAQSNEVYKRCLDNLHDTSARLGKSDAKSIWQKAFVSMLGRIELDSPLYIIIDGLDETDSPQTLMAFLASAPSHFPVRVVIASRLTNEISSACEKLAQFMPLNRISTEGIGNDITLYVERGLQSMPGGNLLKTRVIDEITRKAAGNFLWVHLAVNEVMNCHTQDEIEQVLQDIPSGMHPLYKRMEESMATSLKQSDQRLGQVLLAWVSCAQRPLSLDELGKAIEPEFAHLLDLKYTISQVCGNLLVIDRKSRVTLVHQTAREYLTRVSTGPFNVDSFAAHQDLFLRCMSYLCDTRVHQQVRQGSSPVLLSYSARSWSFHLQARCAGSDQVLSALSGFLESHAILNWIQTLATENQLKILVQSSHALSAFAEKRRILDSSLAPNLRPLQALEAVDSWAVDLVKIVGKFGPNLVGTPSSIAHFIPQFCPKRSAVYQQFGNKGTVRVHVTGEALSSWDDSLAKLFVGADAQALSIVCTGQYFAILTTSDAIILWDSTTCQESRRLRHKDHVVAMCASADGQKIASYGFHTTKVWDISTGGELHSISNPLGRRALSIAFVEMDSTIICGSDDGSVRRLSLTNPFDGWTTVELDLSKQGLSTAGSMSSPCSLSFNSQASQVAMAFRGAPLAVWGLEDPTMFSRCRRIRVDPMDMNARPWTPVDQVTWHPRSGEVLGIYQDGNVFKWHPFENTYHENSEVAVSVACSPDGDLFATSDANGSVKIWKHQEFVPIYMLRCEYPVADIAFSLDNRRLYDLRGSFCNVWEPNVLVRLADLEKPGSEAASDATSTVLSSTFSEAEVDLVEPITALASEPRGRFYCTGNSDGTVKLLRGTSEKAYAQWTSSNFMPIEHVAYSADGQHIAWRDLGGKVIVKRVGAETHASRGSPAKSETIFDVTIKTNDGPVKQVLLSSTSDFILIAGHRSAQAWSIKSGTHVASWHAKNPNAEFQWMNHPLVSNHLLAVGAERAFSCTWQDLIEKSGFAFDTPKPHKTGKSVIKSNQVRRPSAPRSMSSDNVGPLIENAMLTQDGAHILVETIRYSEHNSNEIQLMVFSKSALEGTDTTLTPKMLPTQLLDRLQLPLGILPGGNLVFLDNEHWICSWQMSSSDATPKIERHFFLPRDWLNSECLELCRLLESGTLLIPKNGELASIESDVGLQW